MQFELKAEIGAEGKNSTAFIAHDPQLDAEIVIKKIEKSKIAHRKTFFEESRALYSSAHSNVDSKSRSFSRARGDTIDQMHSSRPIGNQSWKAATIFRLPSKKASATWRSGAMSTSDVPDFMISAKRL